MAAVTLSSYQIHGHTTPNGFTKASDGKQVLGCFVSIGAVAGTYASADNSSAAAVGAAIAASRRDGRTVTLLQACMASPGKKADGTVIGWRTAAANPTGVSTDALLGELLQPDLSTEHADGALNDTFSEPITLFVLYKH